MKKTKTIREIERKLEILEEESLRAQLLRSVRRFKGNWLELGWYLTLVNEKRAYKDWDYGSFESYCTRELKLRPATVNKLLLSYRFLEKEEPALMEQALQGQSPSRDIPEYDNIDILRKARTRKRVSEPDYNRLRRAVFETGVEPRELGQQYRSLLQATREAETDSEEAWSRRRALTVKKILGSLKAVKDKLENFSFLSNRIVEKLKELIKQIEDEVSGE